MTRRVVWEPWVAVMPCGHRLIAVTEPAMAAAWVEHKDVCATTACRSEDPPSQWWMGTYSEHGPRLDSPKDRLTLH